MQHKAWGPKGYAVRARANGSKIRRWAGALAGAVALDGRALVGFGVWFRV